VAYTDDDDVRAWLNEMARNGRLDLNADNQALALHALFMIDGSVQYVPTTEENRPMATEQERADELYLQLKAEAEQVYLDHIMSRTPPELQDEMRTLVLDGLNGGDPPGPELTPSQVILNMGDSVRVVTVMGGDVPGSPGTAAVTSGRLDFVQLQELTGAERAREPQAQRQAAPSTRRPR
jgi:hypothetical protein